ncbi:UDP-2,3-diacylglucosamine diphosphatase LpxI [Candidatus Sumerlaeota bacterium]|nr:UDP-2,3-diacylglucosamine diphosphatase LpxI [Candidatus Sumerlaeota bacterium]
MRSANKEHLGIIAGQGKFPVMLAREAAQQGVEVFVIAIKDYTSPVISDYASEVHWFELGEIAGMLDTLKKSGIREVALAGRVPHDALLHYSKFDKFSRALLSVLVDKKANSILKMVSSVLAKNGITVIDSLRYLNRYIPKKGLLTQGRPLTDEEKKEINFGLPIARKIAELDIGLTIVVKNQIVVAVEAIEGTDETIKRGAELGGAGVVVIKVARPHQDPRWDLPVVGLRTIQVMQSVNAGCLAISANKTLFFDQEKAITLAEKSNIAIIAV